MSAIKAGQPLVKEIHVMVMMMTMKMTMMIMMMTMMSIVD